MDRWLKVCIISLRRSHLPLLKLVLVSCAAHSWNCLLEQFQRLLSLVTKEQ